ncbi:hypothetical protein Hhel01_02977 [Haloferula helveola]
MVWLLASCQGNGPLPPTATSDFSRAYHRDDARAFELGRRAETLELTHQRVRTKIATHREKIAVTDDEDELDDLEDSLEILNFLDRWIADTSRHHPSDAELLSVNLQAERVLNLMENEEAGSSKAHRVPQLIAGLVPTFVFGHRIASIPRYSRDEPLGPELAGKEASFLYDSRRGVYLTPDHLAGMTPLEVAHTDISPRHPAWHRARSRPTSTLVHFEGEMERGVTAALREDGDLPAGRRWDVDSSRRVLFLDEVYKSATSAKAEVEDAYGVEWKIKWGDECQTEPVSGRLYLLAGAKMTDLVYVGGGGPDEMILILAEPDEYSAEGDKAKTEREAGTVEQLAESLDDFYGFDIGPYIHSHGVITESNVDRLLRHLPNGGKSDYRRSNLIGRHWVSFREYSVELRPKGYIRTLSGTSMTDLAANEDRVARGLYLFSLWLAARDTKNDNNKTYFIKQPSGGRGSKMRITSYFDGHHDLGVTLGDLGSAGEINRMKTGEDFLRDTGRVIKGRQPFVYKPTAYDHTTWSDAKWMADRITALTDRELRQAIDASTWPDFVRETLFFKLASRRNQIAKIFGTANPEARREVAPPNIAIDLSSPSKIRDAEQRYRLAPGSLAEELQRHHSGGSGREVLVRDGQIVPSPESALITQLVIQRYPSGLADRYRRMTNQPPEALRR